MRRFTTAVTAVLLVAGILATPALGASSDPKIVIIVGAVHGQTSDYLKRGQAAYDEAIKYSSNVVKVFSPCATWSKVKSAMKGASIVIYMGHGNGYPSPYRTSPWPYSQNGFGLNAACNEGHYNTKYYGEYYIGDYDGLAPNAVVLLHHLCYASGNSEPGYPEPSVSVAKQRIDNYGAGFLEAGASVVIADGHSGPSYYLWAILNTSQTMDELWRGAPNYRDNVRTWASTRSPGNTAQMDPNNTSSGFDRSIVGDLAFNWALMTRVNVVASKSAQPFAEPSPAPDPSPSPEPSPSSSPAGEALMPDTSGETPVVLSDRP